MKRLSIIPEIFIWLAFSVLAGFGYAFSFFECIGGRASLTAADIVMPTLVWLVVAVFCTCLLRIAKKTQCFAHFTKSESLFLEYGVLVLLLIGGWVFRFSAHFQGLWPVNPDNEFFQYAQVSRSAVSYMNPHAVSRLYVGFLHILFLFLGNIFEAGSLAQFVLLMVGVFFWYMAVRKTFGQITALFFTAGAMLLPDSIVASVQYNPMMLLFAIYGVIAWIIACYAKGKCSGAAAFVCELGIGMLLGASVLLDVSGWVLVAAGGLALRTHQRNREGKSLVTPVASILGVMFGVKAFSFVQSVLYGMSFAEADNFYGCVDWKMQMPDIHQIQEFFFELGSHPVFIVAIVVIVTYWFMNRRLAVTWIMLGVLFFMTLQLLKLDVYLKHDFLIYMGLLVLLGTSVQQFVWGIDKQEETDKKQSPVNGDTTELPNLSFLSDMKVEVSKENSVPFTEDQEPVVTVINFDEQPAVTVEEKQQVRPVIFIPKSMEIPKRISKPKVEFAVEVADEKMHYDLEIEENADFDI